MTKNHLRKIIKEVIVKEGMKEDYKTFQKEVSTTEAGWKKRMSELDTRQTSVNSVKQAQTAIHELLEYFKKTPVSEALGTVKKANVKKFERIFNIIKN